MFSNGGKRSFLPSFWPVDKHFPEAIAGFVGLESAVLSQTAIKSEGSRGAGVNVASKISHSQEKMGATQYIHEGSLKRNLKVPFWKENQIIWNSKIHREEEKNVERIPLNSYQK